MKVSPASFRPFAVFFLCVTGFAASLAAQNDFSIQLSQSGLTSAGIFDSNGNIVRTLWALETFNAGNLSGSWDGLDDFGTPVLPGSYTWKVLRNGAQYKNIGVIGNTGLPPVTSGHVPFFIEGVAVDAQGNAYTVHDWNEPHFDVIRWSTVKGKSEMNTGHAINDALLKAIAVEPDGSFAYVTGYGDSLTDRTKSKFSIWRIRMAPGLGENERVVNFTQQGRSIKVYDGNVGGYPSAGYPTPEYPVTATEVDKDVMRVPLISIAVQDSSLYVTDAIGGRILKYHKVSGNYQSTDQWHTGGVRFGHRAERQYLGGPRALQGERVFALGREAGHAHHRSDGSAGAFHPGKHVGGCRPGGEDLQIHHRWHPGDADGQLWAAPETRRS